MNNVKVSVIVPIYNAQNYIEKCIRSVLKQTFKDFELILINDGSTDESLIICEKLSNEDKRIKVISKENGGSSSAKNLGLRNAEGEYVAFLDADDYLDETHIENLYFGVKNYNADVCISSIAFTTINNKEEVVSKKCVVIDDGCYLLGEFMRFYPRYMSQAIIGAPWNKLYRRDIIISNEIFFNTNIKNNEDTHFNYEYFVKCKTIYVNSNTYYNYINREGVSSASRGYKPNIFDIYVLTFNKAKEFLSKTNSYDVHINYQKDYFMRLVIGAIKGIVSTSQLTIKEKLLQIKSICSNSEVCDCSRSFKSKNYKQKIAISLIKKKRVKMLFLLFKLNR